MRDYQKEFDERVSYIRKKLQISRARGLVYGNSGGKDCTLVGILCKAACDNTIGLVMPCSSKINYGKDKEDALTAADKYGIETRIIDLTDVREAEVSKLSDITAVNDRALANIAPRLRMITLYAVAASENRLVCGTGNRSERYVGYFTKWGDGACDINPISDLTVKEVYEFLRFLKAPQCIIDKKPSAGLFDGQTDEGEMGITYNAIDAYLLGEEVDEKDAEKIRMMHDGSEHKRILPAYSE